MRNSIVLTFILFLFTSVAAHADVYLPFLVNTSSVSGSTGYLDFQFNPGGSNSLPETATIINFAGGSYNSSLGQTTAGAASGGPVPSNIVLPNSTPYNDVFDGFNYGNTIAFTVDLSGLARSNPNPNLPGSSFAFSMFNSSQTPILTSDPYGYAATINLNPDGSITVLTESPDVLALPEPASLGLFGLPLLGLVAARLMRRHTRQV